MTYTNFNYMLSASAVIQEARELQRAANTISEKLAWQIVAYIRGALLPEVKRCDTGGNCFTVPRSTVVGNKQNLSALYYSADSQADLVKEALIPSLKKGIDAMLAKLEELHTRKSAIVSKQAYDLNQNTLDVIGTILKLSRVEGEGYEKGE